MIFGEHHVLVAVGVHERGRKHVLGIAEGASENQTVAKGLLENLVGRGLATDRKYLFVIEASKALRVAINAVFRGGQSGAKVPPAQAGEREGLLAGAPEGSDPGGDAGSLPAPGEGGDGAVGETGGMSGTRISQRRGQLARRFGGDVHGQSAGFIAVFAWALARSATGAMARWCCAGPLRPCS